MADICSFVLREQDGTIIQPWKGVKNLEGFEWIRDAMSVITGVPDNIRVVESATYIYREKDVEVFSPTDSIKPYKTYDVAVFQDDNSDRRYEIADRLARKECKVDIGDKATLTILGCCSIMDIVKKGSKKNKK